MKYYKKAWILFEMLANDVGKMSTDLSVAKPQTNNPDTNKQVPFIEGTKTSYIVKTDKN
ncbi:hypothetical protein [Candidatus Mycoplasma mahonii]|uniref:hypothetical protein n=1 Tax=Candidatus Mycoplasma mahonii TaxID=3004105 RepID=UPI0026EA7098|nr:hypothetical protein [Candidatus Mycoplasma mahonii]WKX02558.1 hypothetical protein O3I44_00555 [Candidatus Mycoplasma mahonii]